MQAKEKPTREAKQKANRPLTIIALSIHRAMNVAENWDVLADLCGTLGQASPPTQHLRAHLTLGSFHLRLDLDTDTDHLRLPFHVMLSIFRPADTDVMIVCRSHDIWRLRFESAFACQQCHTRLTSLCRAAETSSLYAFYYPIEMQMDAQKLASGWKLYRMGEQLARTRIAKDRWRFTEVNRNYALSESLPELVVVPISVPDEMLQNIAAFRALNRLPHVVYHHPNSQAVLCRAGQPLMGAKQKRSIEDEQYLQVLLANADKTKGAVRLPCIIDARTKQHALSQKSKGGGFEADGSYPGIRMFFTSIESPPGIRDAHLRLLDDASMSSTLNDMAAWMRQVQSCLRPALFVAQTVSEGASCLVHCDDGLDASAVLVSLAKIMMDPYFRTVKGFLVLIEEDWLQGGFRFADRCGQPVQATTSAATPTPNALKVLQKEERTLSQSLSSLALDAIGGSSSSSSLAAVSPIWTLFLDCVYQLHRQQCCEFEFTPSLLLLLHLHSASCTFLGNSQQQRQSMSDKTASMWTYIQDRVGSYLNPFYMPQCTDEKVMPISMSSKKLSLWTELHAPWSCPALALAQFSSREDQETDPMVIKARAYRSSILARQARIKALQAQLDAAQ